MSILHDACSKSKVNRGSSAEQELQPMQEIFLEQKSEPVHEPAKFPVMLKTTESSRFIPDLTSDTTNASL